RAHREPRELKLPLQRPGLRLRDDGHAADRRRLGRAGPHLAAHDRLLELHLAAVEGSEAWGEDGPCAVAALDSLGPGERRRGRRVRERRDRRRQEEDQRLRAAHGAGRVAGAA
ncbi:MAG: hypothetical protein ACK56I_06545, partial [bacterium]